MAGKRQTDERIHGQETTGTTIKRRGILAAAGAVVAGIMATKAGQPVAAASGTGADGNLVLGSDGIFPVFANTTTRNTVVQAVPSGFSGKAVFEANASTAPTGVTADGLRGSGQGGGAGVIGFGSPVGTSGSAGPNEGPGVIGVAHGATAPTPGIQGYGGVFGTSVGAFSDGVHGVADNGNGVTGISQTSWGVFGSSNNVGVHGSGNTAGTGVRGDSTNGTGVAGTSTGGSGVVGGSSSATPGTAGGYFYTTANSGSGVVGQCFNPGGGAAAFVGAAVAPNYAAYFTGDVVVTGNFVVGKINGVNTGGGKSAAVQHPLTHDTRLVYCVESPDSWFEDFGEGVLVNGKAEVKVDPRFMALIHTDSYHVFLTEHDDHNALYVANRSASGFSVHAKGTGTQKGATADVAGTFSWRVVGKRSDTTLERFAPYAMPTIKLADKPPAIPGPATPKKP